MNSQNNDWSAACWRGYLRYAAPPFGSAHQRDIPQKYGRPQPQYNLHSIIFRPECLKNNFLQKFQTCKSETLQNYSNMLYVSCDEALEGIYSTVVMCDIMQRIPQSDFNTLQKVIRFLCSNIGSITSPNRISNLLSAEGELDKKSKIAGKTVSNYLEYIQNAFIFYPVERYDIKGKQLLKTLEKYYIADIGFRHLLLGYRDADRGHLLENVVFLELLRRHYRVYIGKIHDLEVDFIAEKHDDKIYIQVTESMLSEETRQRELKPLMTIPDHYSKLVLSMDRDFIHFENGIRMMYLPDWLGG